MVMRHEPETGNLNLSDEPPASAEHVQLVRNTMAILGANLGVFERAVGASVFADALMTLTVRMLVGFYGPEQARVYLANASELTHAIALDMQNPEGRA